MKPEDLSAMLKAEENYMDTLAECASGNARIDFSAGFRKGLAYRDAQPAVAVNEQLLGELRHIAEYWNRDQNERAMADALWHIIRVAESAIEQAEAAKGGV